jgi:uncharacterized protein
MQQRQPDRRPRRWWLSRLLVLILAVIIMKSLVALIEPRLTFYPFEGETDTPATYGLPYRALALRTEDGETIAAWWITHPAARADVVYFHGNGGNLSLWAPVLAGIQARGLNVLAVDYRGYGRSTGTPSEEGLYRDAAAVVRAHGPLGTPGRPVVYWGRSLGGAVAAYATRVARPDGLILESTFASKRAVIRGNPVLRVLDTFARYRFETASHLRGYGGPTLVIHATGDTIIPYAAGRELFERLGGDKQFLELPTGDHNDFHPPSARTYWEAIDGFIDKARMSHDTTNDDGRMTTTNE